MEENFVRTGKMVAIGTMCVFLLLPQAGCGEISVNGFDLATNRLGGEFTLLAWLVVAACAIAFFSNSVSSFLGAGILGIFGLLGMIAKLRSAPEDPFSSMVELKIGSILTLFGLLALAALPFLYNAQDTRKKQP